MLPKDSTPDEEPGVPLVAEEADNEEDIQTSALDEPSAQPASVGADKALDEQNTGQEQAND
jgi:hypothetical protein